MNTKKYFKVYEKNQLGNHKLIGVYKTHSMAQFVMRKNEKRYIKLPLDHLPCVKSESN